MFGSLYWVSLFWSGATFHRWALVGRTEGVVGCSGDGEMGEEGTASSWTTITLSANPITLGAQ